MTSKRQNGCLTNGVICMYQIDIQNQLNVVLSTISNYLPAPYTVVGISVAKRFNLIEVK